MKRLPLFGESDNGDIGRNDGGNDRQLRHSPIENNEIGPGPVRVAEAASHDVFHRGRVAGLVGFDQELPILVFVGPAIGKNDQDADSVFLIEVGHIVALDSSGRFL